MLKAIFFVTSFMATLVTSESLQTANVSLDCNEYYQNDVQNECCDCCPGRDVHSHKCAAKLKRKTFISCDVQQHLHTLNEETSSATQENQVFRCKGRIGAISFVANGVSGISTLALMFVMALTILCNVLLVVYKRHNATTMSRNDEQIHEERNSDRKAIFPKSFAGLSKFSLTIDLPTTSLQAANEMTMVLKEILNFLKHRFEKRTMKLCFFLGILFPISVPQGSDAKSGRRRSQFASNAKSSQKKFIRAKKKCCSERLICK